MRLLTLSQYSGEAQLVQMFNTELALLAYSRRLQCERLTERRARGTLTS